MSRTGKVGDELSTIGPEIPPYWGSKVKLQMKGLRTQLYKRIHERLAATLKNSIDMESGQQDSTSLRIETYVMLVLRNLSTWLAQKGQTLVSTDGDFVKSFIIYRLLLLLDTINLELLFLPRSTRSL